MNKLETDNIINLPQIGTWPQSVHIFEEESVWAIKTAEAAGRPLLVRGEPGTGKSQLARAAAYALGKAFISEVVHSNYECSDLQYTYDAVARLGEAQALSSGIKTGNLDHKRFLSPGPLWWAFDWESAKSQDEDSEIESTIPECNEKWSPEKGCVLLIDEIDKAEVDLPNGLLESLGNGAFKVPYSNQRIGLLPDYPHPLVFITTNEERELPAAFIRRCLVLNLKLPDDEKKLIEYLVQRGKIHFNSKCSESVYRKTAELLYKDRIAAFESGYPIPGQAEYLDILRALSNLQKDVVKQESLLNKISKFAFAKYRI